MSMEQHATNRCLNADEAFEITLLVTCEVVKNILKDRYPNNPKMQYYLDRMDKDVEGINRLIEGYLPESFINKAEKYHKMIEVDMNNLLKSYKEEKE